MVGICPKILCWLGEVKRLIGHIPKVSTILVQCKSARVQTWNRRIWFGWTQTSLWIRHARKFDRGCVQENTKEEARWDSTSSTRFSIVLCNATSRSCEGACLNHEVGKLVEQRETIEVETPRHQLSTFPRNSSSYTSVRLPAEKASEKKRRQSWQIDQEHVRNSRCFPHPATWLCQLDRWRVRRLPKRQTQCSIVPQSESRWENGSARRRLCVNIHAHHTHFLKLRNAGGPELLGLCARDAQVKPYFEQQNLGEWITAEHKVLIETCDSGRKQSPIRYRGAKFGKKKNKADMESFLGIWH